jgi:hypothetical protein
MTAVSEYDLKQQFVEGKCKRLQHARDGFASAVADGFRDVKRILLHGGALGFMRYRDDGDGWFSVSVVGGPFEGRTGLYQAGALICLIDGTAGKSIEVQMP